MGALTQATTPVQTKMSAAEARAIEIANKIQMALDLLEEAEVLGGDLDCPAAVLDEVNAARVAAEYAIGEAETWCGGIWCDRI